MDNEHGYSRFDIEYSRAMRASKELPSKEVRRFVDAAEFGNVEKVLEGIRSGIDVDAKSDYGQTAMWAAVRWGHAPVVRVLLDAHAHVDENALSDAIAYGAPDVARVLLARAAFVPTAEHLVHAVGQVLPGLHGQNETERNNKRIDVVRALLDGGADANARDFTGRSAVDIAAKHNLVEVVRLLFERGAKVTDEKSALEGETAFMSAARHDHPEIARLYIEYGADMNAVNRDGENALMLASRHGAAKAVDVLLAAGMEVDARDDYGNTALTGASKFGFVKCATALLDHGADANVKNAHGDTPLMWAAENADKEMAELLVERGANLDERNNKGKDALSLCGDGVRGAMVAGVLMRAGASVRLDDHGPDLRRTMRLWLADGNAETVAAYCAGGMRPQSRELGKMSGASFERFREHVADIVRTANKKTSEGVALSASERGSLELASVVERHRLTKRVDSVDVALEALRMSAEKAGVPDEQSPYYRAAKEYFTGVPNGDLAFAELIGRAAERDKSSERVSGRSRASTVER